MQEPLSEDHERLELLRALLRRRLLYTMGALYRTEWHARGAQRLLGLSSRLAWDDAVKVADHYNAVCRAIDALDRPAASQVAEDEAGRLLLPEEPNAVGLALMALRGLQSLARWMLPPAALVAIAVYLHHNWPWT